MSLQWGSLLIVLAVLEIVAAKHYGVELKKALSEHQFIPYKPSDDSELSFRTFPKMRLPHMGNERRRGNDDIRSEVESANQRSPPFSQNVIREHMFHEHQMHDSNEVIQQHNQVEESFQPEFGSHDMVPKEINSPYDNDLYDVKRTHQQIRHEPHLVIEEEPLQGFVEYDHVIDSQEQQNEVPQQPVIDLDNYIPADISPNSLSIDSDEFRYNEPINNEHNQNPLTIIEALPRANPFEDEQNERPWNYIMPSANPFHNKPPRDDSTSEADPFHHDPNKTPGDDMTPSSYLFHYTPSIKPWEDITSSTYPTHHKTPRDDFISGGYPSYHKTPRDNIIVSTDPFHDKPPLIDIASSTYPSYHKTPRNDITFSGYPTYHNTPRDDFIFSTDPFHHKTPLIDITSSAYPTHHKTPSDDFISSAYPFYHKTPRDDIMFTTDPFHHITPFIDITPSTYPIHHKPINVPWTEIYPSGDPFHQNPRKESKDDIVPSADPLHNEPNQTPQDFIGSDPFHLEPNKALGHDIMSIADSLHLDPTKKLWVDIMSSIYPYIHHGSYDSVWLDSNNPGADPSNHESNNTPGKNIIPTDPFYRKPKNNPWNAIISRTEPTRSHQIDDTGRPTSFKFMKKHPVFINNMFTPKLIRPIIHGF